VKRYDRGRVNLLDGVGDWTIGEAQQRALQ
jgi:hypothetical protein